MKKLLAVLVVTMVPGLALAQTHVVQEPDRLVIRQRTVVDFSDIHLTSDRDGPPGSYAVVPGRAKFNSLIRLRANFTPELQASVDALH